FGVRWGRVLAVDDDRISSPLAEPLHEIGADRRSEEQGTQTRNRTHTETDQADTIERLATSSSITSVAPPPIGRMRASRYMRSTGVSRM
ncbi:MAG: hypothetical protein RL058_1650, partial [Actinomycetota bacterium]